MKTWILAAAVIALCVPARAQTPDLSSAQETAKSLSKDLAEAVKKAVAEELARRAREAVIDPGPIQTLLDRLSKDGEHDGDESSRIEAAYSYASDDAPNAKGEFDSYKVTLFEVPTPEPDGMYRDAVYRRTFSRMKGMLTHWTPLPKGEAHVDRWIYHITLDGRITDVVYVSVSGKSPSPGIIEVDSKRAEKTKLAPKDPAVLKRWDGMIKRFLIMGRTTWI